MKKLLFLLFGVIFVVVGCSDESGSNGDGVTETCPITSADFTYERVKQNQYKIKLNDESKRQYAGSIRWQSLREPNIKSDNLEPSLEFNKNSVSGEKDIVFYYNNMQCGEKIVLKPVPENLNQNCDMLLIDYFQDYLFMDAESYFFIKLQNIDNNVKYKIVLANNMELQNYKQSTYQKGSIEFNIISANITNLMQEYLGQRIFGDLIIDYPDDSQCIKEICFNRMYGTGGW